MLSFLSSLKRCILKLIDMLSKKEIEERMYNYLIENTEMLYVNGNNVKIQSFEVIDTIPTFGDVGRFTLIELLCGTTIVSIATETYEQNGNVRDYRKKSDLKLKRIYLIGGMLVK